MSLNSLVNSNEGSNSRASLGGKFVAGRKNSMCVCVYDVCVVCVYDVCVCSVCMMCVCVCVYDVCVYDVCV